MSCRWKRNSPRYMRSPPMDINKDGKKDLILAGNNSWTRIRYGKYSANHGIVLTGDGKGNFKYMPQYESGLSVRGDVRSIAQVNNYFILLA